MSKPVTLEGVSVFYGEVVGLSDVSFELEEGITGLVGPNGSGKTTLMRVLTGLMNPQEGTVSVLGGTPFDDASIRTRIAFVPANMCFFERVSGQRNLEIAFVARGYGSRDARALAREALEAVGLTKDGGRAYRTWSRGMRQRLKLGLALTLDVDLVLLDEPFLGVDPPNRYRLREQILELGALGRTVLVSSHVLHEVEALTEQVAILAHGRVLGAGNIETLVAELRDQHPHRIKIVAEPARALAVQLLADALVEQVELRSETRLEVLSHSPDRLYQRIAVVAAEHGVLIRSLTTRDDSLEAVFEHVTKASVARL